MSFLSLGVDIAAATFVAATWSDGQGQLIDTCPNSPEGFTRLAEHLPTDQPIRLVLEPTGGYERALVHFALQQGWQVCLPNPNQVRNFARGRSIRAKTDKRDALLLACFGAEGHPRPWHPLPEAVAELESLQRRKDDIEQMLRQERNRRHALERRPDQHQAVPTSVERVIEVLEEELAELERKLASQVEGHAELKAAVALLRTAPAVGAKTVVPLLIVLWRWDVLTAGQGSAKGLAAYVGLDPKPYESGTSVRKRMMISRMGDRVLRRRLFLAALGRVRHENALRAFYERLVGRGKRKKVALVAAARKLVIWAWKVFQTRTAFDPAKVMHDLPHTA